MCLAIPARVVALLADEQAMVDLGGIRKHISIALVADVQVGDYVIVHVGHAIGSLDPDEAERTLALLAQMAQMAQMTPVAPVTPVTPVAPVTPVTPVAQQPSPLQEQT